MWKGNKNITQEECIFVKELHFWQFNNHRRRPRELGREKREESFGLIATFDRLAPNSREMKKNFQAEERA